ncbi:anthrone oxygenase family protein [Kitasatospora sp. NPDC056327]|uniref:anthrone oxygenase family protein n=1 Tax=Kitasatospora sp. NPDC056327 TaxID=3345785 RepID=UPI0035DBB9C5
MRIRLLRAVSLLSGGLLAGAFGYGAANLVPTFNAVPLDMRLDFHTALMTMNGITVQGTMAVAAVSAFALAHAERGRSRALAGGAGLLVLASFLITRFGNVPINGRIRQWAATAPPPDHAEVLRRWELFNDLRTVTAAVAFGLLVLLVLPRGPGAAPSDVENPAPRA